MDRRIEKLKEFWKDKKVLITGHTGFKGSWLCSILISLGADVKGISNGIPTEPSLFKILDLEDKTDSKFIDIRNRKNLIDCIKEFKPDILFHLAAQPLVRYSYLQPNETYSTNVMGTLNVLESIRESNIPSSVLITTDKVYENKEWDWSYRENESLGGKDPYSSSKACCEILISSFRQSYLDNSQLIASVRAGNVIGGGDWSEDRLIPDLLNKISANQLVHIRSPKAVRPWQHVLEPLLGYMILAERMFEGKTEFATSWNFGPENTDNRTVGEICDLLTTKLGKGEWRIVETDENLKEAGLLKLDITKAKSKLDWKPKWSLEEALDRIVEWHQAYIKGVDLVELTNYQIRTYLEK